MTKENIQEFAVALNSSPSEGAGEGTEAKRNKKTQLLSALLSASALGVFLEGCGGGEDTSGGDGTLGNKSNPFSATDAANTFSGSGNDGWVSYAGSTSELGVNINLDNNPATVSGGWAAEDTLTDIDNLIGTPYADTLTGSDKINSFEGGNGDDMLAGGDNTDTYVFNKGDGTDTITDSGSNRIVFEQGTNNDYADATYTLSNGALKLTVAKDSETLNIIDFSEIPYDYTFYTRSGDTDTEILDASLILAARAGSESNPFMATDAAERFTASQGADWVSYENSEEGVTIDLNNFPAATVSGGWAAGDTLTNIRNLIGSIHVDTLSGNSFSNTFEGGRGNDILAGGGSFDTYVFNANDDTDTITDSGGNKIVFEQGTNNDDYVDATYTLSNGNLKLTVAKGGETLNIIDFTSYPSAYTFYTRDNNGIETVIPPSDLVVPPIPGSEGNPFMATVASDSFAGSQGADWVSYAGSNAGVTINLGSNPAAFSDGWAAEDNLTDINNVIGSIHVDNLSGDSDANTFEGGRGDDILAGGGRTDTYVFNKGDGTDTITDSGSNRIVFEQGTNNDYADATYTLSNVDGKVRLTVTNSSETLNIIDFTNDPSEHFFFTRSDGNLTLLVVPASQNSPSSLPLPADSIGSSDTYIFEAGDGKQIIRGDIDGLGNNLIFRAPAGEAYADADFQSNRGFLGDYLVLSEANDGNDLEIVVSREGIETNRVIVQGYFSTGDDESYTIYRNALSEDTIVSDILAETS